MIISSFSNQKVKELVLLQKKSSIRKKQGVFVVEGIRLVSEIPPGCLLELYVSSHFVDKHPDLVRDFTKRFSVLPIQLSDPVFDKISDTVQPQGILAIVKRSEHSMEKMIEKLNPFLIILDQIQDPGNLGTIFRTAEAAGVDGIVMSFDSVDIYNPKTIRSTMGAIFRLPFYVTRDMKATLSFMKSQNITIYAAHLDGAKDYVQENYQKGCGILIGNEGNGLREEIAAMADAMIKIPMESQAESLNAGVAAAILMYEANRQRRNDCGATTASDESNL